MEQKGNSVGTGFDSNLPSTSSRALVKHESVNISSQNSSLTDARVSETRVSSSTDDSSSSEKEDEAVEYTQLGGYHQGTVPWSDKASENESISQFLNGKLTFSEYAQQINVADDDEDGISSIFSNEVHSKSIPKAEIDTSRPKGRKRRKFVRRHLPPALKGLMGEANLKFARGDTDVAIKMCFEIIRHVPTAPEPYQTLAGLYEELGHPDKARQMSLIAAHLSPSDSNQWIHLAEVSYVQGDNKQAIMCYTKALRADEKNIEVHFKRAELLEREGLKYIALKGFSRLLTLLDPVKEGDKILELSKLVAEMYHKEKDLVKTKQTLEIAFEKCPSLITSEHINLLLEVLLSLGDYTNALETLIRFCDVSVEFETSQTGLIVVDTCTVPKDMAIDLRVKLILTLIHFKSVKPVDVLLQPLKAAEVDEVGDLYLDVAEAFMVEGLYENALPLLVSLIASKSYSLPAVWLNYAECLKNSGKIEESVKAYLHVIEQVPQHNNARLIAAQLLKNLGRRDEAINLLVQDEKCDLLDPEILYEKCMLLKDKPEQVNDYLEAGQLFLSRHFLRIRRFEELRTISNFRGSSIYKKKAAVKDVRILLGLPNEDEPHFREEKNMPSVEKEWDLFIDMCRICYKLRSFHLLQRLSFSAQGSELFFPFSKEIDILCLMSSFYNKDSYMGFNYARQLVMRDINSTRAWNLFNLVIIRGDDARHNKFVMRLLSRNQTHPLLSSLHANNCLVSGTYKYALNEYVSAYRKEKTAMLAFLIGVTLSQMACQKFSAKKHSLVTQAIAFFSKYQELRGVGGVQEYHYNLGRVYHQLGLLPPALQHYKMALECKPKFVNGCSAVFDLSREAAYNLHLIYLQSGADDIARMYLEKYIVV